MSSNRTQMLVGIVVVAIVIAIIYFGAGRMTGGVADSSTDNHEIRTATTCKVTTPTGPSAVATGDGKIRFSWNGVPGANSYVIYVGSNKEVGPSQFEHKIETSTNPLVWEIADGLSLSKDHKTYFAIVAKRDVCVDEDCLTCLSKPTDPLPVALNCSVPEMPVLFAETKVVDGTLFASWYPTEVDYYVLYFKRLTLDATSPHQPGPQNYDERVVVEHPTWWYVFEMPDDGPWSFAVSAVNSCGESQPSLPFIK